MAIESVKQRLGSLSNSRDEAQLRIAITAVLDALQAVATKLDSDAGVTSTDYAAAVAAIVID